MLLVCSAVSIDRNDPGPSIALKSPSKFKTFAGL